MAKGISKESTAFENEVLKVGQAYKAAGLADIEKVDPPTRTFGHGRSLRTIYLVNPFLDIIGTWTEMGGKTLQLECKVTNDPTLSLGYIREDGEASSSNGITAAQIQAGLRWSAAGAACAYLWRFDNQTRLVTPSMCVAQLKHRKSFRWADAHPVPQGTGFILIDFLALLRRIHKPKP